MIELDAVQPTSLDKLQSFVDLVTGVLTELLDNKFQRLSDVYGVLRVPSSRWIKYWQGRGPQSPNQNKNKSKMVALRCVRGVWWRSRS